MFILTREQIAAKKSRKFSEVFVPELEGGLRFGSPSAATMMELRAAQSSTNPELEFTKVLLAGTLVDDKDVDLFTIATIHDGFISKVSPAVLGVALEAATKLLTSGAAVSQGNLSASPSES